MSYWLEDRDGNYLGDLATNLGINQLRNAGIGSLRQFLDMGEADDQLVQQIIKDTSLMPSVAYVADLLKNAKPPVFVTDGCGDINQGEDKP